MHIGSQTAICICVFLESSAGVSLIAFSEDALHGLDRFILRGGEDLVNSDDHSAIKISSNLVRGILRKSRARFRQIVLQILVSDF